MKMLLNLYSAIEANAQPVFCPLCRKVIGVMFPREFSRRFAPGGLCLASFQSHCLSDDEIWISAGVGQTEGKEGYVITKHSLGWNQAHGSCFVLYAIMFVL